MAGDDVTSFGDLVRRARRAAGLSQEDLADRAGLSVRGISDLERGVNRTPRKDTLEMLADALNLSADERQTWERARRRFATSPAHEQATAHPPAERTTATLPARLTSFVGREHEIAGLQELLGRPGVRLVTVTGPGGIGKTSLAVQMAVEAATRFPDGVRFISLASVHDPALVASTIVSTLGLQVHGAKDPTATLINALAERQILLLLDNFEQVIDAASLVADFLKACPALTVLVTSRAPLRLSGEWEYPLVPLSLPPGHDATNVAAVARAPAVALFVERATAVRPDFALTAENAAAVAEICRRLDGLPLAIELAAARIRHLSPPAMLERLEHRLAFLTGGVRDAPTRHQTLRDTIAWSYDLLSTDDQRLFRTASLFRGGWTRDALEDVVGEGPDIDVLDGMDRLIEHSLVSSVEQPDGDVRYLMLETIREFGVEQLSTSDEGSELTRRYERYFVDLAERASSELQSPSQSRWLAILDREHANLRSTLAGLLERGDGVTALKTAVAIRPFWRSRGYFVEGRQWLERALAAGGTAPAAIQAEAQMAIGAAARAQGDLVEAERSLTAAAARYRAAGDDVGLANAINGRAWNAIYRGEFRQANDLLEQALRAAHSAGDDRLLATILGSQSVGWAGLGEYALARAAAEESLARWQAIGNRMAVCQVLGYLGYYWLWQGDLDHAEQFGQECLAVAEELGDELEVFANELLGYVALEREEYEQAGSLFRLSVTVSATQQAFMNLAESLEGLAGVAAGRGDLERGALLLGAAEAVRQRYQSPVPPPRQDRYQRTVSAIRSGLDAAVFDGAWTAGQLMSHERVIEYALHGEQSITMDAHLTTGADLPM